MKELCLVAVVNDGYQEYIPLFVYFALYAYPEYEVIVYLEGTLHPEVDACLRALRAMGSFDVRPLLYRCDPGDGQAFKSLRWVLYDDDFAAYDNVYIGDIDVLLAREEPSLCVRRVGHSEAIGLPYSNRIRPNTTKLAGIAHFVRTQAYFPRLLPVMQRRRAELAAQTLRMHNEELLYRMMEETVGLPDPQASLATHHGIHLRAFHTRRTLAEERQRTDYLFAKTFERQFDAFLPAVRDEVCVDMVRRLRRIESPPARLARYPEGGPAILRQLENVLALCDGLMAERAAAP
jgi:hypothetical protein